MGAIRISLRRLLRRLSDGPPQPSPEQLQRDQGLVAVGRHTYAQPRAHFYAGDSVKVRIGSFCSIAKDVELLPGGNHHPEWVSTFPFRIEFGLPGAFEDGQPWSKGDINIGNDVWIGRGARILGGVTIGDGAVVAAYSVVAKDVLPYSIVAGNPAQHRRFRFGVDTRKSLRRIAWWDWSDELLAARVADLCSSDVETFIEKYDSTSAPAATHRDSTSQ